jgi:hypothetical protein
MRRPTLDEILGAILFVVIVITGLLMRE